MEPRNGYRNALNRIGATPLMMAARLADAGGAPLRADRVEARFVRPTNAGHDFALDLTRRGAGAYGAEVEMPVAGQWDVRLLVVRAADSFQLRERVFVAP